MMNYRLLLLILLIGSKVVWADGIVVDKVYHPYVLPNEKEFEWRLMSRQTEDNSLLGQRIAYGQSVSDSVVVEGYLVGEKTVEEDFDLQAYEIEVRWMLTEQGELWADWGMLFEVEKMHSSNDWEVTTGVLFEKEFGRTSLTMNLFGIYEWGDNIQDEVEVEFRMKYRYRWIPQIQPAIEIYTGENFVGIGPAFMGIQRFDGQKQLKWEAAFISEISNAGKDHTLRVALEYEF
ncbi:MULTISPECIES: hypothetical protein [Thalassotalea]|uniref:Uncharacterized protein n=1 Tax=Thalassotalea castellviae TaxID=3075612 RepID=A0ABU2ZXH8_9GAMM|nr:hypothetical protein [Thalassotalea sp. W431]MDT0602328.1 hypothetical protein [Thalassotalea sp. W431]